MPNPRRRSFSDPVGTIALHGRRWPILDRWNVGRSRYLLLERLGTPPRERYLAFDPDAGIRGEARALLVLPRSVATRQQLRVLEQLAGSNGNVPRIFQCRADGERVVVAMDWIRGPTVAEYLAGVRSGKTVAPSPYEAVRLVRGLAHGLRQLHRGRQIIHGDVKPANLILAREPTRLVLIDFGSAWLAESTMRRNEGDGTSPCYAAPELHMPTPKVADFRADIFSASVVLHELLTLKLPYDGLGGKAGRSEYVEEMRDRWQPPSHAAAWKSAVPVAVRQQIDQVVAIGAALEIERRFATPDAWLQALDQLFRELQHPTDGVALPSLWALFKHKVLRRSPSY